MKTERLWVLASVIALHPHKKVEGRTRLQKTIWLLQRLGLPTDFDYMLFFYGPYSEGLQSEVHLLERMNMIEEKPSEGEGVSYTIHSKEDDIKGIDDIRRIFGHKIELLAEKPSVILELAATYDAFRKLGYDHGDALKALRRKKGKKCDNGNQEKALELISELELDN